MAEHRPTLANAIQTAWFRRDLAVFLWPLLPISWLFGFIVRLRRRAYRSGWLRRERLPVPVVVVGNLIVGGAGKTPLALHLVEGLKAAGRQPGIISRGHGGKGMVSPVYPDSDPVQVGDEPVLLAARAGVPVYVGRRRAEAGYALLKAHPEVDVLVCDDGLQHHALARDVEIVVCDRRGLGNHRLLPAGPLREPETTMQSVDAVVVQGGGDCAGGHRFIMELVPAAFHHLHDPARRVAAADLRRGAFHAIAGIGHPERFFDTLRRLGLDFEPHAFPDHHAYCAEEISFSPDAVLLMTEKDAVKCRPFYRGEAWVLPVTAVVSPDLPAFVLERIDGRQAA